MISAYPSIFALGHKAVVDLLTSPVVVQEKIDGSQFSFGVHAQEDGVQTFQCRSKGAELQVLSPEKMFARGIETAHTLWIHGKLNPGWTYRAEYLTKPKHNTLVYDRVPKDNLILFDVDRGNQDYLTPGELAVEGQRLGLEVVPTLREGLVTDLQDFRVLLDTPSILGGQKVEGVVIKNYTLYGPDKKVLMGKFVSEAFKEAHSVEWKSGNPNSGGIIQTLVAQYRTPSRWAKGVQHLRDARRLEDSPRDIGVLFKEVPKDLMQEEAEAIRDTLFAWAWPKIQRGACAGLAEWYKEELLKKQFEGGTSDDS